MKKNSTFRLYESFHKSSGTQKTIMDRNNYTYFNVVRALDAAIADEKNLKILDFGCGVGTTSTYLAQLGHTVLGLDISKKSIAVARKNALSAEVADRCSFAVIGKDYDLAKDAQTYDLICLIEVAEHLPDDVFTLKQLVKKFKKGGRLLITTRSVNSLIYRLGLVADFEKRVGHVRRYTDAAFITLFTQLGLELVQYQKVDSIIRDCLYCFQPLGFLVRYIRGPVRNLMMLAEKPMIWLSGNSGYVGLAVKPLRSSKGV